ncbi:MAG: hypothetical protein WC381_01485 [Kiritimatiellia bacterium]
MPQRPLAREAVRNEFSARGGAGHSWKAFEAALARTPAGNDGKIGFYFKEPEITPTVLKPGIYRFGPDERPARFTPDQNVRAVMEGQCLSMRLHANNIGLVPQKNPGRRRRSGERELVAGHGGRVWGGGACLQPAELGLARRHPPGLARLARYAQLEKRVLVISPQSVRGQSRDTSGA